MILLGLGANLPSPAGPPAETLQHALIVMGQRGIATALISRFYRTKAWPLPSDPEFVNCVARVETWFPPGELLTRLHAVEAEFGRRRGRPNAPRTLDIDLLDYHGRRSGACPQLPHPRLAERLFVLVPLRDVAPDWNDPRTGHRVDDLIARSAGESEWPVVLT
jgi:2-amino-4-hydroxy-6-hydroxymethyldihydropteridine diphosphokinase